MKLQKEAWHMTKNKMIMEKKEDLSMDGDGEAI